VTDPCIFRDAGRDPAGAHHADADRRPLKFVPQRIAEPAHGEFAGAVGGLAGGADETEEARDVDELRLRPLLERRQEGARHAHEAVEVDRQQPFEVLLAHFVETSDEPDARIVEEQVHRRMRGGDDLGEGGDLVAIGDIECVAGEA